MDRLSPLDVWNIRDAARKLDELASQVRALAATAERAERSGRAHQSAAEPSPRQKKPKV
jgi:hypothetical protein